MTQGQASAVVVTFADSVPQAEADEVAAAIRMLRGVASVRPLSEADVAVARAVIDAEWRERIVGLLDDEGV